MDKRQGKTWQWLYCINNIYVWTRACSLDHPPDSNGIRRKKCERERGRKRTREKWMLCKNNLTRKCVYILMCCHVSAYSHARTHTRTYIYKEIPWTSTMNMSIFIYFSVFLSSAAFVWSCLPRASSLDCSFDKDADDDNNIETAARVRVVFCFWFYFFMYDAVHFDLPLGIMITRMHTCS